MSNEDYQQYFLRDPQSEPLYGFESMNAVTLFFEDFFPAINYYTAVLGEPHYKEGEYTYGWRISSAWLTILKGSAGNPRNVEIAFMMQNAAEADRLQQAFIAAGGVGQPPQDTLMYDPVHLCPVTDPFGVEIMVFARSEKQLGYPD